MSLKVAWRSAEDCKALGPMVSLVPTTQSSPEASEKVRQSSTGRERNAIIGTPERALRRDVLVALMSELSRVGKVERAGMPDTAGMKLHEKQAAWAVAVQNGCHEAWKPLFDSTSSWAYRVASRLMLGRLGGQTSNDTIADLMAEIQLRLYEHIDEFDPQRASWVTWTTWQIRAAAGRSITNCSRTVRLPSGLQEIAGKVKAFAVAFEKENRRQPTSAEVMRALGVSSRRLQTIYRSEQKTVSIDEPNGFGDRIAATPDLSKPSALETVLEDEQREVVRAAVAKLAEEDPRMVRIIRSRFGFGNGEPRILSDVGKQFGLTRERIRQLEVRALARLRDMLSDGGARSRKQTFAKSKVPCADCKRWTAHASKICGRCSKKRAQARQVTK